MLLEEEVLREVEGLARHLLIETGLTDPAEVLDRIPDTIIAQGLIDHTEAITQEVVTTDVVQVLHPGLIVATGLILPEDLHTPGQARQIAVRATEEPHGPAGREVPL